MKKKFAFALAAAMLCLSLTGCGDTGIQNNTSSEKIEKNDSDELNKSDNNDNSADTAASGADNNGDSTKEAAKSLEEIYELITEAVELNAPMVVAPAYIMNAYGIDTETLDEYVFSLSESSISAETIIMIKVGDGSDVNTVSDQLTVWRGYREEELVDYLPEQYNLVADSNITIKDDYIWLVISENAAAILDIINSNL